MYTIGGFDYIVVETACENCGEINDHLTAHCPYVESYFAEIRSVIARYSGVIVWLAGRFM